MAPRERKTSEVRRLEIVQAALTIIGEQGATALRTANLAHAVGLTPGALFRHFASIDEILEATVRHAIELAEATFPSQTQPPVARLRAFVGARVALVHATPGLRWLLLSDQVFLTVPSAAIQHLRALVQRSRDFLLTAIEDGIAEGRLRDDIEPQVMLILVTGAIHSLIGRGGVHRGRSDDGPEPDVVIDTLFSLLTKDSK